MFITRYSAKADNWNLMRILKKREKDPKDVYTLPKIGYLVFEEDVVIGAGFLRQCEGGYGLFDSYITNPTIGPKLRDQALEMITKNLVITAKNMGITHLIGFSVDANTITRSQRHGFILTDYKVITQVL